MHLRIPVIKVESSSSRITGMAAIPLISFFVFAVIFIVVFLGKTARHQQAGSGTAQLSGKTCQLNKKNVPRPFGCFMKDFDGLPVEDLVRARKAFSFLWPELSTDETKLEEARNAGELIYLARAREFDRLFTDISIILVPPSRNYETISAEDIDKYRRTAAAFAVAGYFLMKENRRKEALHILLSLIAFSTHVSNGDGGPPSHISEEIASSVRNYSSGPFTWHLLVPPEPEPLLEEDTLLLYSGTIETLENMLVPFSDILISEKSLLAEKLRSNLISCMRNCNSSQIEKSLVYLEHRIDELYGKTIDLFSRCRKNEFTFDYRKLDSEISALSWELIDRSRILKESGDMESFIPEKLLLDSYPNYIQTLLNREKSLLRIRAMQKLALAVHALTKKKNEWPLSPGDFEKLMAGIMLRDPFRISEGLTEPVCIYSYKNGKAKLFSVGFDGKFEDGDPDKDLLLFDTDISRFIRKE